MAMGRSTGRKLGSRNGSSRANARQGLAHRLDALGGTLEVHSKPQLGTGVIGSDPIGRASA
jgi:hypothetical protein